MRQKNYKGRCEKRVINKCKTIYPSPQIRIAASDIYPVCSGEVGQHDFKIRSTASTVVASTPE